MLPAQGISAHKDANDGTNGCTRAAGWRRSTGVHFAVCLFVELLFLELFRQRPVGFHYSSLSMCRAFHFSIILAN